MTIQHINPPALAPSANYSHMVRAKGEMLFITGQLARDKSGLLVGEGDAGEQFRQAWSNMVAALEHVGLTTDHLAKLNIYVVGVDNLQDVRNARKDFPLKAPPPSTLVVVAALAQPGALVEVEAVAVFP